MSKTYVSAVPLTMVRLVDGGYRNVLEGDPIAGEAVDAKDLKRLVRKGFLVEHKPPKEKGSSSSNDDPNPGTAAYVLKEVGTDKAKAKAALDQEKAGQNRTTLIADLEKILAG